MAGPDRAEVGPAQAKAWNLCLDCLAQSEIAERVGVDQKRHRIG